jgi:hypothetical protein
MDATPLTEQVPLDFSQTEATIDRLITKAERLKALLDEMEGKISNLDDELALAEGVEKKPQIVWSISLGEVSKILMAPKEAFGQPVLDLVARDLAQLINGVAKVPENEVTKGKVVELCRE